MNRLQRCVKSYDLKMKHPSVLTISTPPVGQTGFCTSVPVCSECFQVCIHRTSLLSKVIGMALPQIIHYPSFELDVLCSVFVIPLQQKLFSYQAEPPQRVDSLALRWETALSVFPKDTATRYHIGIRTNVSQAFDY